MRLNERWRNRLICIVLGAAIATGQAPFGFWPVSIIALIVLVARFSKSHGFWYGWWNGLGYFALALNWIVEPFLVDIARHGWMAPFALVGLASGLAIFWGLAFWVAGRFGPQRMVLPFAWALAEFARSTILTGFPWALISYIWVDTPIAQAAAFVGPHTLGALTVLLAVVAAWCWHHRRSWLAAPALAFLVAWLGFATRLPDTSDLSDFTVRLIQPNAAQDLKWRPDMMQTFFDRQLSATSAPGSPDLVVWPEVAVPYVMGQRPDLDQMIANAAPDGVSVVVGMRKLLEKSPKNEWRNSLVVLDPDGNNVASYDKYRLVPFGEFLPFPDVFEALGLQALAANAGRFGSGDGPAVLKVPGIPDFQPLICYESIFPADIRRGDDRPQWLLQITNDAWFGTFSGPFQHLAQARMRAIENGLPLARSANTGVSAMIDPFGRILDQLPLNQFGYIDAALPKALPATLYARTGDLIWILLITSMPLLVVVFSRLVVIRRSRTQEKNGPAAG